VITTRLNQRRASAVESMTVREEMYNIDTQCIQVHVEQNNKSYLDSIWRWNGSGNLVVDSHRSSIGLI
jgi:hypothetical protein